MQKNTKTHFLYPSAIFVNRSPHIVTTILGSCVAVCLWDTEYKFGGINHYMLPLWNGEGLASPKYGNIAIEKLIDKMMGLGSKKEKIQAKIFGGAENLKDQANRFHIGQRNILIARELLKKHHIRLISYSVGGHTGRKIQFNTETGEVFMKYIKKADQNRLAS